MTTRMRLLTVLIVSIVSLFEVGASCKPPASTHYYVTVPFKNEKQLNSAEFINQVKELLVQQIYTNYNIVEKQNIESINGKTRVSFDSSSNSFSSGILINPQMDICFGNLVMSVEKKYVHDLAYNYLTKVIEIDIATLKVLEQENRNSKTLVVKVKLDNLKRKEHYYSMIEPLALLSDNNFDVSKYREFKTLLNKLDLDIIGFDELSDEIAYYISAEQYNQADDKLSKLEILADTKQQYKVYSILQKRNNTKRNKSFIRDKKILRETSINNYFVFYEGQINSVFETNPMQQTSYNVNGLSSHALGVQFNDPTNTYGIVGLYRRYLNSFAMVDGDLPFLFTRDLNELAAGLYYKVNTDRFTVGLRADVGMVLNRFVGKYAYGLSESNLSDFSQYVRMNGKNYVTVSPRVFLNFSSKNLVPTFYLGSTFFSGENKINFASLNVGTVIKIKMNKIRKNDLEKLKHRYTSNN